MKPTNDKLHAKADRYRLGASDVKEDQELEDLLQKWTAMNTARSLFPLAAAVVGLWAVVSWTHGGHKCVLILLAFGNQRVILSTKLRLKAEVRMRSANRVNILTLLTGWSDGTRRAWIVAKVADFERHFLPSLNINRGNISFQVLWLTQPKSLSISWDDNTRSHVNTVA